MTYQTPHRYQEIIYTLYGANTFAFLHNTVSFDFCRITLSYHLRRIRSAHVHFQFRQLFTPGFTFEEQPDFPLPWSMTTFGNFNDKPSIRDTISNLTNLRSLSVFLQGPLLQDVSKYSSICSVLSSIRDELESLQFMVVRFPRPCLDGSIQNRAPYYQDRWELVRRNMAEQDKRRFQIIQPPVEPEQSAHHLADLDVEVDGG
jgi:hypothetical protein